LFCFYGNEKIKNKKILPALKIPKIWGLQHDSNFQFMKDVTVSDFCALLLDTCRPSPSNSATDREEKRRIGEPKVGGLQPCSPPSPRRNLKNAGFVNMIVSNILCDLPFSLYQSPKSDDD
jgi:hypothetical protein